jgi:hypothetical protein
MMITRYPGTLGANGFGQHAFSSGGTGVNDLLVRNTTAGAANVGQATVQADGAGFVALQMFSTTHTATGAITAAGARLVHTGAGTFGFETISAGGFRFFPGGGLRMTVDFSNGVLVENQFGVRVKNTAGTAIDGVVITAGNEMHIGSDSAAGMGDTILRGGSGIRFRTSSAERLHISSAGVVSPGTTGTQDIGTSSLRWGVAYVSSIDTGDVRFDNKFKLTEHDKVGIDTPGMALCNAFGRVVAFFDEDGNVYANRVAQLSELRP